jgi:hypothetical protein
MARLRSGSDAKLSEDKGHAEGPGDTAVLSLDNVMKGGMNESRAFEALVEWARDSSACSGGYCDWVRGSGWVEKRCESLKDD